MEQSVTLIGFGEAGSTFTLSGGVARGIDIDSSREPGMAKPGLGMGAAEALRDASLVAAGEVMAAVRGCSVMWLIIRGALGHLTRCLHRHYHVPASNTMIGHIGLEPIGRRDHETGA